MLGVAESVKDVKPSGAVPSSGPAAVAWVASSWWLEVQVPDMLEARESVFPVGQISAICHPLLHYKICFL